MPSCSHEMDVLSLILLVAGSIALIQAARRIRKVWTAHRGKHYTFRSIFSHPTVDMSNSWAGRSRGRIDWQFSYQVLPIPQCSLQLDDPDSISWITNRLTARASTSHSEGLPSTRPDRRNGTVDSARSSKSGIVATLRHYSYFYVSPVVAIVGGVLAISLLCYQAGWTVDTIIVKIRGLAAASAADANGVSSGFSISSPAPRPVKRDLTGATLRSVREGDLGYRSHPGDAAMPSGLPDDRGSILQPLVCPCFIWFLYFTQFNHIDSTSLVLLLA